MRKRGVPPLVEGEKLRELRDEVRFTKVTYEKLAEKYGYATGMGVLKAAQRYEKEHGLGPEDPSPEPEKNELGDVVDPATGTGDLSAAISLLPTEASA